MENNNNKKNNNNNNSSNSLVFGRWPQTKILDNAIYGLLSVSAKVGTKTKQKLSSDFFLPESPLGVVASFGAV